MLKRSVLGFEKVHGGRAKEVRRFVNFIMGGVTTPVSKTQVDDAHVNVHDENPNTPPTVPYGENVHTPDPVQVHNDGNVPTPPTVPYGDSEDSEDSEEDKSSTTTTITYGEEEEDSEDSEDLEDSEDSEEDKSSTTIPYGEEEEEAYAQDQGPAANQDFMAWFTQNHVSSVPIAHVHTPGPVQETRAARRARRPGVTPPTTKR